MEPEPGRQGEVCVVLRAPLSPYQCDLRCDTVPAVGRVMKYGLMQYWRPGILETQVGTENQSTLAHAEECIFG